MKEAMELDLKEIFRVLLKRAWIIILCAVLVGGLTLGYTAKFVTPMYRAKVTMYVNNNAGNNTGNISSSNLAVALQLVNTYMYMITSDTVLQGVADEMNLDTQPAALRKLVSTEAVKDTEMFAVYVTHKDPKFAADVANAIAKVAPPLIKQFTGGSNAQIIDYAKVPTSRVSPSYRTNAIVGALVGGVLAAAVFVSQILLDNRIKSEEDLQKICDFPVLGMIPDFAQVTKEEKKNKTKAKTNPTPTTREKTKGGR